MLFRIVMRDSSGSNAGEDWMTMEDSVMAVLGQCICAYSRCGRGGSGMAVHEAMMLFLPNSYRGSANGAGQHEAASEGNGKGSFMRSLIYC